MSNIFRVGNQSPVVISVKSEQQEAIKNKKNDLQIVEEKILKRKKELKELEKQGSDIISNAEKRSKEILDAATQKNKEADNILKKANDKAEKIINKANEEAVKIKKDTKKQARNEGQKKGFEEGLEKGRTLGKEELKILIEKAEQIRNSILNERKDLLNEVEEEAITLILNIIKKIFKIEPRINKEIIKNTVTEAIKRINDKDRVVVHVNISDINKVKDHKDHFIELIGAVKEFDIIQDVSVLQGGCIIETNLGNIDATIDTQLLEVERSFLDILRK